MIQENKTWLSAYLFYTGNWEHFLVDQVKPFVDEMIANKYVEEFFFIRYWEKGPHIRLRLKGRSEVLENIVQRALEKYFNDFFLKNPSHRDEQDWQKDLPEDVRAYPNNSIQFIPYEPEYERYGGMGGMPIGEEQFEASSLAVLSIFSENADWDYDKAMGAAIQMHLSFAQALGMDLKEAAHFYSGIFQAWLYMTYDWNDLSKEEHMRKRKIVLDAFEDQFAKQHAVLVPYHLSVWEALESGEEFEEHWLNKWIEDVKMTGKKMTAAQKNGELTFPEDSLITNTWDVSMEKRQLYFIYGSYVHMTNNRLGILNRDEAFLGYLIKRSLEMLSAETIQS